MHECLKAPGVYAVRHDGHDGLYLIEVFHLRCTTTGETLVMVNFYGEGSDIRDLKDLAEEGYEVVAGPMIEKEVAA